MRGGDLDVAVSTAPKRSLDGLEMRTFVDEPLFVIAPRDVEPGPVEEILKSLPFIWFSRKTWAGQQIDQALYDLGIVVRDDMEVDSLLAVHSTCVSRIRCVRCSAASAGAKLP